MKATPEEYNLHQRMLVRDDRTTFEELVNLVYTRLINDIIGSTGPRANPHNIEEAVGQALLDYRERPDRYNPHRNSLYSYLRLMAYRDFQDAQRKEQKHATHQVSFADPTLIGQEFAEDEEDPESRLHAKALWKLIETALPDDKDKKLALLVVNKARPLEVYVKLLGLEHLPKATQREIVKREKDRIVKHLRRLGEDIHE